MTTEWKEARTHREPKWPFFGFAPGNYMGKCHDCGEACTGMDKRAVRCLPCAMDSARVSDAASREQNKRLEDENMVLRSAISIVRDDVKVEINPSVIFPDLSKVIVT